MQTYDYIIVGAGIAGCSVAYELKKHTQSILLLDKNPDVANGASGAAGAFLSPLLGKPNSFKDLITKALLYSTEFYKKHCSEYIDNCGTTRIPKDEEDRKKFQSYIPYMDFEYKKDGDGYFFPIASVVDSYGICKFLSQEIETYFDTDVKEIKYEDGLWALNGTFKTKNIIFTTGYETELLKQEYIQIRPVWGRRIDIETSTKTPYNYHKSCSLSRSKNGQVSIGATHHRDKKEVDEISKNHQELLEKANDIQKLDDVKIIKNYVGARASSFDYFPIIGEVIDLQATLKEFPYLINGTHVQKERFVTYNNLYIFNGVGGRGFVLSPYLAKLLVESIYSDEYLDDSLTVNRLFLRYVKKIKKDKLDEILANT
jgi:tRNA 5-methylaminomethyl-2-thiouridine biosynthesis bifunctional protein